MMLFKIIVGAALNTVLSGLLLHRICLLLLDEQVLK